MHSPPGHKDFLIAVSKTLNTIYPKVRQSSVLQILLNKRDKHSNLRINKDIIITKADKGDTTVIMNTTHLLNLAHKHLSDEDTYLLLNTRPNIKGNGEI